MVDLQSELPLRAAIDVSYGAQEDDHRLDVLVPVTAGPAAPVVIRFEGPAWGWGPRSAAMAPFANPLLAQRGFVTVGATVRPSDAISWPGQLDDALEVLSWVKENPLGLPIDPGRVGVWGQSAGAHLGSMLALAASPDILAVVAISAPFDLADTRWSAAFEAASPVTKLLGGLSAATPAARRSASPVHCLAALVPEFFLIHGVDDVTVPFDQALDMQSALTSQGQPTELLRVPGGHHNLLPDAEAPYSGEVWRQVGHRAADFFHSTFGTDR